MDREKAIKGLEQFKADLKPFCGNRADWERFDAGVALLKEQEHKDRMFHALEDDWKRLKELLKEKEKRIEDLQDVITTLVT